MLITRDAISVDLLIMVAAAPISSQKLKEIWPFYQVDFPGKSLENGNQELLLDFGALNVFMCMYIM